MEYSWCDEWENIGYYFFPGVKTAVGRFTVEETQRHMGIPISDLITLTRCMSFLTCGYSYTQTCKKMQRNQFFFPLYPYIVTMEIVCGL